MRATLPTSILALVARRAAVRDCPMTGCLPTCSTTTCVALHPSAGPSRLFKPLRTAQRLVDLGVRCSPRPVTDLLSFDDLAERAEVMLDGSGPR